MTSTVPQTPADAAQTRPAATILLLRDHDGRMEVLMLRRHARSGFAASAWVFPGGVVDPADSMLDPSCWTGLDPIAPDERLDLPSAQVLGMYVAAVRETFEEAGVLLATRRDGSAHGVPDDVLRDVRAALNDREVPSDFNGFLVDHALVLNLSSLTYWLRWVTPIQEPRRYDTCFFLAHLPPGADPQPDRVETTEALWICPADVVADPEFPVIFPTRRTLEWMAEMGSITELVNHARSRDTVPSLQPHIVVDDDGRYRRIMMPDEAGYPHELYA